MTVWLEGFLQGLIASWAVDWGASHPLDLEKSLHVVREYERHRSLTEVERRLLPDFLLLGLLADTAGEVSGHLELGGDVDSTVLRDNTYKRYLHYVNDARWLATFRRELAGI